MPIIGPLPANILAGQSVSAAPVMANLQWIVSQVNANVPVIPPAPTLSRVMVRQVGATAFTTAVPIIIGKTDAGLTTTKSLDTLTEFNTATGIFTASVAGNYQIMVNAMGIPPGATFTAEPVLKCLKNAALCSEQSFFCTVGGGVGFDTFVAHNFAVVSLGAGETLSATATVFFTGTQPNYQYGNLSIVGLG